MMRHADKVVTVYHKEWSPEEGTDKYQHTVLAGVSFFSRIATVISTEGLSAACEGVLRIPMGSYPDGLVLKNGDLVCEGCLQTGIRMPSELDGQCPYVFTVVGITYNDSGKEPHVKVVCK